MGLSKYEIEPCSATHSVTDRLTATGLEGTTMDSARESIRTRGWLEWLKESGARLVMLTLSPRAAFLCLCLRAAATRSPRSIIQVPRACHALVGGCHAPFTTITEFLQAVTAQRW